MFKNNTVYQFSLNRIFCSIFLIFNVLVSAQKYTIKFIDADTKAPIKNLLVTTDTREEYISNDIGEIRINNKIQYVSYKGKDFVSYTFTLAFEGFHNFELFKMKSMDIPELILKKPEVIYYGNMLPKKIRGYLSSSINTKELIAVNEIFINKGGLLNTYNFHIASEKKYNIPFYFILYESINGKPGKEINRKMITDYLEGTNIISLIDLKIYIEAGDYFVAMQWINPIGSETFRETYKDENGVPIIIYGQQLSISKNYVKDERLKSYTYKNGKMYTFGSMYSQGISILTTK